MKFKDYTRLSKISLKSRKKSTKHTIIGIVFGLIMLIPVIYLSFAFKIDMTNAINETKSISVIDLYTNNQNAPTSIEQWDIKFLSKESANKVFEDNNELIDEILFSQYFEISNEAVVEIEGYEKFKAFKYNEQFNYTEPINIKAVDLSNSNGFPKHYLKDLGKDALKCGTYLNKDNKGEILISEDIAKKVTTNYESLLNKTITVSGFIYNNSNENAGFFEKYVTVIDKFIIKGIISEDYYKLNDKTQREPDLMINFKSIHDQYLFENLSGYKETNEGGHQYITDYYDYSNIEELENNAKINKQVCIAKPLIKYKTGHGLTDHNAINSYNISMKDYNSTLIVDDYINNLFRTTFNLDENQRVNCTLKSSLFEKFKLLNQTATIIILVLYIFGGIIFFATLLNLYNSINYSVESRSNYLGMMRAIGAQNSTINKLYLVEIIMLFVKALPWAIIFSLGISLGIKFGIDSMFVNGSEIIGTTIKLSFNYYFVSLAIVIFFIFIIGLLFSFIACRPITKHRILDVLESDK